MIELLRARRSIRQYTNKRIEPEKIEILNSMDMYELEYQFGVPR